ncbi:50S ribosomal protein L29 [Acetobacter orientalis]|uniref:Large ribosomal subunit protein uL29 n=1 Tax=Acetobacter orientalis TaxID=146474 RepID=A0A252BGF1_9PROT|nr:50S ribosomal protein L29 [Acetobacter orientalis]MCP1221608.1 50S ribosomal protein L29 [Acetobacter orientalis]OUI84050.1 50S ribosomal protein L29 [Acetobacter orientalis]OUJ03507.1 50S ribosomal protein L29 [Acetobacter orientalis]OUJ16997.1 50S ribosomal protein L29 [Acetobacter orientalis]BBC81667.1 50S ribosomal protein L29 [Acetobacter orientalis]
MAKATKPADLRAKTADELNALLLDLKREQLNLRFQQATGQTEGQSRIRVVRREIARIKTIVAQNEKSAAGAKTSAAIS